MENAKVNPIFKKGLSNNLNKYRPTSVLPTLLKLIEKYVHVSFVEYLNHYKLLYKCQSGFRKQQSCETALINMIDKWLKALNDGELVSIIMIDYAKAFDMVLHEIIS